MGNHPVNSKRQHRPSECVGFNKHDTDDERLVTILQRERRISTKSEPPLDELNISTYSIDSSIITFSIQVLPFDAYASITGTFTDWIEHKMMKSNGQFIIRVRITHGCHYYRILVNGRPRFLPNETIECHSQFGRAHFIYVTTNDYNVNNFLELSIFSHHKSPLWTQEINNQFIESDQPPPPHIPPHLLNILLNQKLPTNCDPDVLPEPNLVMLRHLYALSIQNGIMILSTTIRYKKKFVTTCFYKPNL